VGGKIQSHRIPYGRYCQDQETVLTATDQAFRDTKTTDKMEAESERSRDDLEQERAKWQVERLGYMDTINRSRDATIIKAQESALRQQEKDLKRMRQELQIGNEKWQADREQWQANTEDLYRLLDQSERISALEEAQARLQADVERQDTCVGQDETRIQELERQLREKDTKSVQDATLIKELQDQVKEQATTIDQAKTTIQDLGTRLEEQTAQINQGEFRVQELQRMNSKADAMVLELRALVGVLKIRVELKAEFEVMKCREAELARRFREVMQRDSKRTRTEDNHGIETQPSSKRLVSAPSAP